jgi:hypothetical protein
MRIKYNKKFEKLTGNNFSIDSVKPCEYALLTDNEDIIEVHGCYFFKKFALKGKLADNLNKMEYEFDTNKIRVDDLIEKEVTSIESFWCGLSLVKDLIRIILNSHGHGFEIVLSYNYEHCFVRFYKIREGVNNVMSDDLEGFKLEAILRILF